jgi:hypothetical protein
METLLTVAVILTTLAIIVQAGVLVSMYLLSRRLTDKADLLMNDSRQITSNLKVVANDMVETGKTARKMVLRPIREYSAIALAVAEGLRTLLKERKTATDTIKEERPAA